MRSFLIISLSCLLSFIDTTAQQTKRIHSRKKNRAMYSEAYSRDVKRLPPIDRIEIIATASLPQEEWGKIDCNDPRNKCNAIGYLPMRELKTKTLAGAKAQKLAHMWRALEPGGGAGCFTPGYQLRFTNREKVILIANVCFHCCNVTLNGASIHSICGDKSIREFKKMVLASLPHPHEVSEK